MNARTWPPGIRPSGKGIRIRIFREGKLYYSETIAGNPYNKNDLASALRRREWLESRKRLGLSLFEQDSETINEVFSELAQDYLNSLDVKEPSVNTRSLELLAIPSRSAVRYLSHLEASIWFTSRYFLDVGCVLGNV